jgi:cysteine desulfurase / selenocysteine lyase
MDTINVERTRAARSKTDVARWRRAFPVLRSRVHGKPLVYLDNAATTQKPQSRDRCGVALYADDNANVHRGVHSLSQRATDAFEAARARVQAFIHAASPRRNHLRARSHRGDQSGCPEFRRPLLVPGDEILVSAMEHHSNIVPWQQVCRQTGAVSSKSCRSMMPASCASPSTSVCSARARAWSR